MSRLSFAADSLSYSKLIFVPHLDELKMLISQRKAQTYPSTAYSLRQPQLWLHKQIPQTMWH